MARQSRRYEDLNVMRNRNSQVLPVTGALFEHAKHMLVRRGVQPPQQKAGVPAMEAADLGGLVGANPALVQLAAERFWASRVAGTTEFPLRTRIVLPAGGSAGAVGERKPIKFGRVVVDLEGLLPYKFAGGTVLSNEMIFAANGTIKSSAQDRLIAAAVDAANFHALSDAAASADAPAGLANGAATIAASSDLLAGVRALFEELGPSVDPSSLAFLTDTLTAMKLGTYVTPDGALAFPNVGVHGGDILGVPVIVTHSSPSDGSPPEGSLLLVDGSAIAYWLDSVEFDVSEQGSVELSDAPTGDGATPAAASQQMVSMWTNELLALKAVLRASWKVVRSGAVAVLVGI
jgi:hypothetical protein